MTVARYVEQVIEQLSTRMTRGATCLALVAALGLEPSLLDALITDLPVQKVVHVEIPRGDDAGMVALASTATQLDEPGLRDLVQSPSTPWKEKLGCVKKCIDALPADSMILVDAFHWARRAGAAVEQIDPQDAFFFDRADDVFETLWHAKSANKILATRSEIRGVEPVRLTPVTLQDALPELSRELDGCLKPFQNLKKPPVVWRMLGALAAAGVDTARLRHEPSDRLVKHELAKLALESPELRRILLHLAILRLPFPRNVLDDIGASALDSKHRRMLDILLPKGEDGLLRVPHAISRLIGDRILQKDPAWYDSTELERAHRFGATHHRRQFERATAEGRMDLAVREEMEEIHHLTELGDVRTLLSRQLAFVEQYDALGKVLSQRALRVHDDEKEHQLRSDAIGAYERAIEHDPNDAYAHHYVAYNLDILATEPERVEREYLVARDLEPAHPWYHGRYICFLITLARMQDARNAWDRALMDVEPEASPPIYYEELHKHVARLLLARAELDFARGVLDDVPEKYREPWWRALDRLHHSLEEDRDDRLVFPANVARNERWNGPHLLPNPTDTAHIASWNPGRVVSRDKKNVHLRIAVKGQPGAHDDISYMSMTRRELEKTWKTKLEDLTRGAFVELLEYTDGTRKILHWGRGSARFDDLPKLFPPSDRYIRRAFAHS